ncbi:MAG: ATP-grasp domain-containing protein, partial [Brachybacterium sp.]
GDFAVASQAMIFHDEDAIVTRIPTEQDKAEIERRFPGTLLTLTVGEGDRLSELPGQDSYRYVLGKLYLGADSTEQLVADYAAITAELPFEFAPAPADD